MIKVLIVDGESRARDIIKTFVQWEKLGMELVGEAEDAQDALRKTDELHPHVVITDIRMGTCGVGLLQALHERYPQIRTIVVSASTDYHYAAEALRYRVLDYLLKPVDQIELNSVLLNCKRIIRSKNINC
ncbi:response regulator [Paenibacillus sp. LHD-38]|uniref:response regulator n=1 Tax=Paenibacillus sp. LHD-38 TaxID=3072143 RepID=UPI00280F0799|nr:response regulator [Paenibacillus sp. LHD-38]MDQ8739261.1 response regulator [Paenibacillus sp. LHD-38]